MNIEKVQIISPPYHGRNSEPRHENARGDSSKILAPIELKPAQRNSGLQITLPIRLSKSDRRGEALILPFGRFVLERRPMRLFTLHITTALIANVLFNYLREILLMCAALV